MIWFCIIITGVCDKEQTWFNFNFLSKTMLSLCLPSKDFQPIHAYKRYGYVISYNVYHRKFV